MIDICAYVFCMFWRNFFSSTLQKIIAQSKKKGPFSLAWVHSIQIIKKLQKDKYLSEHRQDVRRKAREEGIAYLALWIPCRPCCYWCRCCRFLPRVEKPERRSGWDELGPTVPTISAGTKAAWAATWRAASRNDWCECCSKVWRSRLLHLWIDLCDYYRRMYEYVEGRYDNGEHGMLQLTEISSGNVGTQSLSL